MGEFEKELRADFEEQVESVARQMTRLGGFDKVPDELRADAIEAVMAINRVRARRIVWECLRPSTKLFLMETHGPVC
jgi:hypothetical protein